MSKYSDSESDSDSDSSNDIKLEKQPPKVIDEKPSKIKKPYELVDEKPKRKYERKKKIETEAMNEKLAKARAARKPIIKKEKQPKTKEIVELKQPKTIIKNYYYTQPEAKPEVKPVKQQPKTMIPIKKAPIFI